MTIIYKPWTVEQVKNLEVRQADTTKHPYTCAFGDSALIPTQDGLACPECDYVQNWCHDFDANGEEDD